MTLLTKEKRGLKIKAIISTNKLMKIGQSVEILVDERNTLTEELNDIIYIYNNNELYGNFITG
jgi:hypothetical protein